MIDFRSAGADDAEGVAALHADSWRRHYRHTYSAAYLDVHALDDRRTVWAARLAAPAGTRTILAEDDGVLVGFVHVILDDDERWGSLVDNLHVSDARRRGGIGTVLLAHAAAGTIEGARSPRLYLWVLEANAAAQRFYTSNGGEIVGTEAVTGPYLVGPANKLRVAWPDAAVLTAPTSPAAPTSPTAVAD